MQGISDRSAATILGERARSYEKSLHCNEFSVFTKFGLLVGVLKDPLENESVLGWLNPETLRPGRFGCEDTLLVADTCGRMLNVTFAAGPMSSEEPGGSTSQPRMSDRASGLGLACAP